MKIKGLIYFCLFFLFTPIILAQNILIDDFENGYSKWTFEGDSDTFGSVPAKGKSQYQSQIKGYNGEYLVNSFYYSGNDPIGKMILKDLFVINRKYLLASIGGGYDKENIYLRVVDTEGNELGRLTGHHSELLRVKYLDLSPFQGRKAYIEIVDNWDNPWWGHINVDDIYLSDSLEADVIISTIDIEVKNRYLILPVKNKSNDNRFLEVINTTADKSNQIFYIEVLPLDFTNPDWKAALHVESLIGRKIKIRVEHNKNEIPKIEQSDTIPYRSDFPDEIFRPQYFYSAGQGYLNDPNGLVYWKGRWHLFYQYTPTAIDARKKSWGHAVSDDLMTWQELPPAIDAFYENGEEHNIFSGTGFVDKENNSRLFDTPDGGVIFSFTCTGKGEYIAYADDEYLMDIKMMKHNPIITQNGRDPRIFFNKESKKWGILRYEEFENDNLSIREKNKLENVRKAFSFYNSKDLKNWEYTSSIENCYECPDMFSVDTEQGEKHIVFDASGKYLIGTFDGKDFVADGDSRPRIMQGSFYAMQHFQNAPDNRIVTVGWVGQDIDKMKEYNMCFSQAISIPMDMILHKDSHDKFYLTALPAKEIYNKIKETLYEKSFLHPVCKSIEIPNVPTSAVINLELIWNNGNNATVSIGDMNILFDKQEAALYISKDKDSPPQIFKVEKPNDEKLKLQIFIDRSIVAIFYDVGQTVVFNSCFLGKDDIPVEVSATNGIITNLSVKSIDGR